MPEMCFPFPRPADLPSQGKDKQVFSTQIWWVKFGGAVPVSQRSNKAALDHADACAVSPCCWLLAGVRPSCNSDRRRWLLQTPPSLQVSPRTQQGAAEALGLILLWFRVLFYVALLCLVVVFLFFFFFGSSLVDEVRSVESFTCFCWRFVLALCAGGGPVWSQAARAAERTGVLAQKVFQPE